MSNEIIPVKEPGALTGLAVKPAVFLLNEKAWERFFGFFTPHIRNRNTRRAYYKAACRFSDWSLTVGEAMFVLELMSYKWSENAPFPSYKSLAAKMGVTDKMVRRFAANLEGKGYLRRQARIGSTNTFDLNPLFAALAAALENEKKVPQAA